MNTHTRSFVMVEQGRLRERIEAAIESLLLVLDQLDSDPDLEPDNDDEPSLGWEGFSPASFGGGCSLGSLDCEWDLAENGIADWEGLIEQWGGAWNGCRVE